MNNRRLLTRRNVLVAGAAAVGGLLWGRWSYTKLELPPTYGNILRMGDNLTYAAHRVLLPRQTMVREYRRSDISSFPVIFLDDRFLKPDHPMNNNQFRAWHANGFSDWPGLEVTGLVARPKTYSLAELKRLDSRTQITRHTCEEGWSAIGEWTGVPLWRVLEEDVGILPEARYVTFHSYDNYDDSIDLLDALHPQTLLAYGMNGRDLTVPHGAPVRLRLETQMGYKSMKYLKRIDVTSELEDGGDNGNIKAGWSWYAGI